MLTFIPHIVLSITPVIRKKKVKVTRLEKQIKHEDGFAISQNPFAARGCELCKENTKQSGVSRNSVLKSGPRTCQVRVYSSRGSGQVRTKADEGEGQRAGQGISPAGVETDWIQRQGG